MEFFWPLYHNIRQVYVDFTIWRNVAFFLLIFGLTLQKVLWIQLCSPVCPSICPSALLSVPLPFHLSVRPPVTPFFSGFAQHFSPFFAWSLDSINKKVTKTIFSEKLLLCPKLGKWDIFQFSTFDFSLNLPLKIFLKWYLMTSIKIG